jgi:transposase
MERLPRKVYTYEFKMEAVRLVESGQHIAEAARSLGVVEQTLSNWIRAHNAGKLTANGRGAKLTAEQIEIPSCEPNWPGSRWSATSWEKRRHTSRGARNEVCPYLSPSSSLASSPAV